MIQCRIFARGECGAELCRATGQACSRYCPDRAYKSYGWEVTVRFWPPISEDRTYHWRGCTENGARRKGMLKPHACEIVKVEPITEKEWIRAFGDPTLKNES